jgi:hypothetical protein
MATEAEFDVDAVIEKLLEVRGQRPGKQVRLSFRQNRREASIPRVSLDSRTPILANR